MGSLASLEMVVSGLELMMVLTSHNKVCKDSSSKQLPCSRRRVPRSLRAVLTCLSDSTHVTCCKLVELPVNLLMVKLLSDLIGVHFIESFGSLFAPTKLVPLSHLISRKGPQRAIKRQSTLRKQSVSSEFATSINVDGSAYHSRKHYPISLLSLRPCLVQRNRPQHR